MGSRLTAWARVADASLPRKGAGALGAVGVGSAGDDGVAGTSAITTRGAARRPLGILV